MTPNSILKILVIEDDPVVASRLTSYLAGLGWHVDFAASGKAALRFSQSAEYDVILLDMDMPDAPGVDICRQLKSISETPVLLMAACEIEKDALIVAGADDFTSALTDYKDVVGRCQKLAQQQALAITA